MSKEKDGTKRFLCAKYDNYFFCTKGSGMQQPKSELTKVFEDFIKEYVSSNFGHDPGVDEKSNAPVLKEIDRKKEKRLVAEFLSKDCSCGKNCQNKFFEDELLEARENFWYLTWNEKNCVILTQLNSFQRISDHTKSARTIKVRTRKKFEYRINADRLVCRDTFLFFHGESLKRLKHLQKHLAEVGTSLPIHGNTGRKPKHVCSFEDKQDVKSFIVNFAAMHGMPDPGRDLRKGKGKLRILLPTVLNYKTVHRIYQKSVSGRARQLEYRSFVRIWQEIVPYICFNKARTDLCITCENFKKALNQIASDMEEARDDEKIRIHQQAIEHLDLAKKERGFYQHCIRLAEKGYVKLGPRQRVPPCKPNFRSISMHYSWDFAQQVHYPYEDQQVGPIYFKIPRRAQLFGICCEGIPRQTNYLIDEADFLNKGSNTVISLLDHFFSNHGLGEKHAYLTADNCVGQNKNNAILQYLTYRTLVDLHDKIQLSFMIVGHTKFAPDGYFGLIKKRYRRSRVYTYDQLAYVIEKSSKNGHNLCQRYRNTSGYPNFKYRDWAKWLSKYFKKLPDITKYHHFSIDKNMPGVVITRETTDGPEERHALLKNTFPFSNKKSPELPMELFPSGLSAERSWYLYDKIREHIPSLKDKDETCPLPNVPKPKTKQGEKKR